LLVPDVPAMASDERRIRHLAGRPLVALGFHARPVDFNAPFVDATPTMMEDAPGPEMAKFDRKAVPDARTKLPASETGREWRKSETSGKVEISPQIQARFPKSPVANRNRHQPATRANLRALRMAVSRDLHAVRPPAT
jgi:hypothetical protein